MQENNHRLRECLRETKVKKYQLARRLGIRANELSVILREELDKKTQDRYIKVVREIAAEVKAAG